MNKTKRIVSTLVLLSMLCMFFVALPTAADAADGNLLTNGALADADADGMPDGWSLVKEPSLVTPDTEGYTSLTGWAGNYLKIEESDAKGAGVSQDIRSLELGELYKASVLYTGTTKNLRWDLTVLYYADANATAQTIDKAPLELKYTYTLLSSSQGDATFIATTDGALKNEVVFKMPTIKEGSLPEGASIGLRIKVSSSATGIDASIADIRLEKTKNWVANGSFEGGLSGDWASISTNAAADSSAVVLSEDSGVPEGKNYLRIIDTKSKRFLRKKVNLDGGKTYRFSFWYKSSSNKKAAGGIHNEGGASYYANLTNGANTLADNVESSAWRQYTYYFTLPETYTAPANIRLTMPYQGGGDGGDFCYDNVGIWEVASDGEVQMYSTGADNAVLSDIPTAGSKIKVRGIMKTSEPDSADMAIALYKLNGDKKQIVNIEYYAGTEQAVQTYQESNTLKTQPTGFIEFSEEYTLPSTLEADAEYELKAFAWDALEGLKPLGEPYTIKTAAKEQN